MMKWRIVFFSRKAYITKIIQARVESVNEEDAAALKREKGASCYAQIRTGVCQRLDILSTTRDRSIVRFILRKEDSIRVKRVCIMCSQSRR